LTRALRVYSRTLAQPSSYSVGVSSLTWWFAPHPAWEPGEDWPQEVPVVKYETDEEVVLIDPFLPPTADFEPHQKAVRVLLTQPAHYRGTADFVNGYGASVWGPPKAEWRKRPNPTTSRDLPSGVEAIELDGEQQQVVFFIRDHATLVTGDVLSGTGGRLHVFVDEADPTRLLRALRALGELPIEQVIIPHGELIARDGAARIRTAVTEAEEQR
jgi:glyoxylase-like metal-dependent hydrolase (beta-lactamase superfamily II)